jgi:hypothetical protein
LGRSFAPVSGRANQVPLVLWRAQVIILASITSMAD